MSWEVTSAGGSKVPLLADDMYDAVCVGIYDLGTQVNDYQGQETKQHKALFTWVVLNETVDIDGEDKPRYVSKEYTVSLNQRANLRKDLEGWRGAPFSTDGIAAFDITKVLGTTCRLLIGTTSTGRSNKVEAVKKAKAQVAVPEGITPLIYQIEKAGGPAFPDGLPEWVQEKIQVSPEWKALSGQAPAPKLEEVAVPAPAEEEEEDLPF